MERSRHASLALSATSLIGCRGISLRPDRSRFTAPITNRMGFHTLTTCACRISICWLCGGDLSPPSSLPTLSMDVLDALEAGDFTSKIIRLEERRKTPTNDRHHHSILRLSLVNMSDSALNLR
jgi:hypothetical protein